MGDATYIDGEMEVYEYSQDNSEFITRISKPKGIIMSTIFQNYFRLEIYKSIAKLMNMNTLIGEKLPTTWKQVFNFALLNLFYVFRTGYNLGIKE